MINQNTTLCFSIAERQGTFGVRFHNEVYQSLGLDFLYIPREVKPDELENAINGLRAFGIKGCSISMPYKKKSIFFVDELDETAESILAINTIVNDNGYLKGYNTDYSGAKRILEELDPKERENIVLLGAGGAAKAIAEAAINLGAKLTIVNRTYEKSEELRASMGSLSTVRVDLWNKRNSLEGNILINATSIGMEDPTDSPIAAEGIKKFEIIMDIIPSPHTTKLLEIGRNLKKRVIHGRVMAVYQAVDQIKLYTGRDTPQGIINKYLQ